MTHAFTRRGFIGTAAAVAGGVVVAPRTAHAYAPGSGVVPWIDRNAVPLRGTEPTGSLEDLHPLRQLVHGAAVVGLGESAHGTHEQFALKHRVARYLVERLGFRTIAWEEPWGSGVAIDRYVTTGEGDPRAIVRDASFLLQNEDMLALMRWMRAFNRHRGDDDKVRFLGADVQQLRAVQFDELVRHVEDVAPARLPELRRDLDPIRLRGTMNEHFAWYFGLTSAERDRLVAPARRVYELTASLPSGRSEIEHAYAVQHAWAILGFYDSYTEAGDKGDFRDRYMVETLARWRRTHGHRIVYSAANAHTTATRSTIISFPPDEPVVRQLAGGLLRSRYGRGYVSIALVFQHGAVTAGWDTGTPATFQVPAPDEGFVDHTLGRARLDDYLLDLRTPAPPAVRRWFDRPTRTRVIGGAAYDAGNDAAHHIGVDSYRDGFDAVLHTMTVTPSRLLR